MPLQTNKPVRLVDLISTRFFQFYFSDFQNELNSQIQSKKKEFEKEIENEIKTAEKEIEHLKKESLGNITIISEEMASKVIEQISGAPMNQRSIKAAILEATKKNMGKYL